MTSTGVGTRLVDHFSKRPRNTHNEGWSELWDSSEDDLWNRGKPSPALIDFIESRSDHLPRPSNINRHLRALVPGCGKGYDVVMLAFHGFEAYGLEVSPKAVEIAREYAEKELFQSSEHNFADVDTWLNSPQGSVSFVCGDFFSRDWESSCLTQEGVQGFDLIYDYTFLCALPPDARKDWAQRMSELLRPTGVLVCLEFPLYKSLDAPGPAWGLKGVYWDLLAEDGDGILSCDTSTKKDVDIHEGGKEERQGAFRRVMYFKPGRTYDIGKDTDMMSFWEKKDIST